MAVFCRLEHVVPWVIAARPWAAEGGPTAGIERPQSCSQCGAALGPDQLLLVRHRAAHRITDGFCDRAELGAWATAGGRWRT